MRAVQRLTECRFRLYSTFSYASACCCVFDRTGLLFLGGMS